MFEDLSLWLPENLESLTPDFSFKVETVLSVLSDLNLVDILINSLNTQKKMNRQSPAFSKILIKCRHYNGANIHCGAKYSK